MKKFFRVAAYVSLTVASGLCLLWQIVEKHSEFVTRNEIHQYEYEGVRLWTHYALEVVFAGTISGMGYLGMGLGIPFLAFLLGEWWYLRPAKNPPSFPPIMPPRP